MKPRQNSWDYTPGARPATPGCSSEPALPDMSAVIESVKSGSKPVCVEWPLKCVISREDCSVTLYCKITGPNMVATWYRDGVPIEISTRVTQIEFKPWYKLRIYQIDFRDQGIYSIMCRNDNSYVMSETILNLDIPMDNQLYKLAGAIAIKASQLHIKEHLKNVRVQAGEPFELVAKCNQNPSVPFIFDWYKNNIKIDRNDQQYSRTHYHNGTQLNVEKATVGDSGVYVIVIRCGYSVVTSMSMVVVTDIDLEGLTNMSVPSFLEPPPDQISTTNGEDVVIIFKVCMDDRCAITWYKDDEEDIVLTNTCLENYGGGIMGLRIISPNHLSLGRYTIKLKSKATGQHVRASCFVSIIPVLPWMYPLIDVIKPLKTIITTIGSRSIVFDCAFAVTQHENCYVVWRVNKYAIRRTTASFELASKDGHYILRIRVVEPDMLGEVTCELRRYLHDKRTVPANTTSALLIHVPPAVLQEEINGTGCLKAPKSYTTIGRYRTDIRWKTARSTVRDLESSCSMFYDPTIKYEGVWPFTIKAKPCPRELNFAVQPNPKGLTEADDNFSLHDLMQSGSSDNPEASNYQSTSSLEGTAGTSTAAALSELSLENNHFDEILFDLLYCKLDSEKIHIGALSKCDLDDTEITVTIYEKRTLSDHKIVVVEWDVHESENNYQWFAVEISRPNGTYMQVGKTNQSFFEIHNPLCKEMLGFRVRPITIRNGAPDSRVVVDPDAFLPREPEYKDVELMDISHFKFGYRSLRTSVGSGAFGTVMLLEDSYGQCFAAKYISTRTEDKRHMARREFETMRLLRHSKCVQLHAAFLGPDYFVLVMDYLWGGELFERILQEENFTESDAVIYMRQLCDGMKYLHSLQFVHLDIKPENIICIGENSRRVKLIDFGLARSLRDQDVRCLTGTKDYMAPETLAYERLTTAADMWSLGVLTYVMLSGVFPFTGHSWASQSMNIARAFYNYDDLSMRALSSRARNFIDNLLVREPSRRMTAALALEHPWLVSGPPVALDIGHINRRWRSNLRHYLDTSKQRWQRAGKAVVAAHRLRTNVGEARKRPYSPSDI